MWYRMSFNPEPKIMGCDTQVKALHGDALKFKQELGNVIYKQVLDTNTKIDYAELKPIAKFTDVLWDHCLGGLGLFVSEKAKEILSSFKLYNARFHPAIVKKGGEEKKYYYLRLTGDISEHFDYTKSDFIWYQSIPDHLGNDVPVKFANAKEYIKRELEIESPDSIYAEKLYFTEDFLVEKYDVIILGTLDPLSIWVNGNVKTGIELAGLTGFDFMPNDFLMNE